MYLLLNSIISYLNNLSYIRAEKVFLTLIFVVVFIKGVVMIDPDFSWRLRAGNYILENSVPKTDLYTYTMPSFPWVDHAWATDALISSVHNIAGMPGLGLLLSLLFIYTIKLVCGSIQGAGKKQVDGSFPEEAALSRYLNPVVLLLIGILLPFVSVRVQVVTWILLAILLKLIFDKLLWAKFKYLLPLFFMVWTNLHGGFVSGLTIVWLVMGIRFIKREVKPSDLLVVFLSSAATLINPYGLGVYREVWSSISDNRLRFEIIEWRPAFLTFDIPTIAFFALSTVFVCIYRQKIALEKLAVYLVLLLQGIASIRHLPLWAIMATPVTINALEYFYRDSLKNKVSQKRFMSMFKYVFLFCIITLGFQVWFSLKGAYYLSEDKFYPKKAVYFLKNNLPEGEIFSDYGWGGYLIQHLPEKKVFIDGRMPSWKNPNSPDRESPDAMEEYLKVMKGKSDYKEIFDKYNVTTVLWPMKKPKSKLDKLEEKLSEKFNFLYKALGFSDKKFYLTEKLESEGWKKVYEDEVARIYTR